MRRFIAFNIGRKVLKTLEFTHPLLKGLRPLKLKRIPIHGQWEGEVSQAIDRVLKETGPRTIPVCLIPGSLFFVRRYSFPLSLKRKVRDILPFEMEDDIPISRGEAVFDYLPSSQGDETLEVMVFILPRHILETYVGLFPEGKRPAMVAPEHAALASLKPLKEVGRYCLIGVEQDRVSMVLMEERMVHAARAFDVDGDASGVADGILETLQIWEGNGRPERFQILGERVSEIEKILASKGITSTPCIDASPLASIRDATPYLSLLGLAHLAVEGRFNLREEGERQAGLLSLLRGLKPLYPGVVAILVLTGVDLYMRHQALKARLFAIDREIEGTFRAIMPHVKRVVNERAQLRKALQEESRKLKAIKDLVAFDPLPYLEVLKRDFDLLGIRLLEISVDERGLTFHGETEREETIKELIERFRREKGVEKAEITLIDRTTGIIRFSGRLSPSPSGP